MGVSKSQSRAAVQELLPGSETMWVGVKVEQLCAPCCASEKVSALFAPGYMTTQSTGLWRVWLQKYECVYGTQDGK